LLLTRLLPAAALLLALFAPGAALAQRDTTREALSRLEESTLLQIEEGGLEPKELLPAIVVGVRPAFEESKAWYPTAALSTLVRVFGAAGLRSCEACMAPRLWVEPGRVEQQSAELGAPEIVRLDESSRGTAAPARSAIWLDETAEGVSLRIIDLRNSRIVLAQNFDASLGEQARSERNLQLSRELARRARGDSIAHTFFDVIVYPGQHLSMDFADQWGETNANLFGVSVSLYDPVLGVGAGYYRVMPRALNLMVGAKVLMSVPTALVNSITDENQEVIDPLLTGVLLVRVPVGQTNYGVTLGLSTNGQVGIGLCLMNLSMLPFLP
jgi:hypothetical protein